MNATYNLVDENWIPCIDRNGTVVHRSLFDTLVGAHDLVEVRDESPLVTVTLHRLLLAILHRVFGPATPTEWGKIWAGGNGRFDPAKLEAYLKSPAIHPRFDLFDTHHPFYQTPGLPLGVPDKKNGGRGKFVKPIWRIALELAYSDSLNLFAHFKKGDWETRPAAEAARWLVAFQSFASPGLQTFEDGRSQDRSADAGLLFKSAVVLVRGDNLFQTLWLNTVHYSGSEEAPFAFKAAKDQAAWEKDEPTQPADRSIDGYLDLLTWQSRRVRLVPELDTARGFLGVSGVVTMKGWQLPGFDRYGRETMVGFMKPEKVPDGQDPWPPLGFRIGRELWRDSHALFANIAEKSARPRVLNWIDDLRAELGLLDRDAVQLDIYGLRNDPTKVAVVLFWRHESLPLPLAYLNTPGLVEHLRDALRLAEAVATDVLRKAAWKAAATRLTGDTGDADTDRVRALVDSFAPERLYWSRLEAPYRALLVDLAAPEADPAALRSRWFHDTVARTAREAFEETLGRVEGGRNYKAGATGRQVLSRLLRKLQRHEQIPDHEPKEGAA